MRVFQVLSVLTVMLMLLLTLSVSMFAKEAEQTLPKDLLVLSKANCFDGAGNQVDFVPPLQEAYWRASEKVESIRKNLEWMMVHSTPSGRLFAACLLCRLNKNVKALQSLESDKTEVVYSSGCRRNDHDSVGRIAKYIAELPGHYLLADNGSPPKK